MEDGANQMKADLIENLIIAHSTGDDGCFQIIGPSGIIRYQLLLKTTVTVSWYPDMKFSIRGIKIAFIESIPTVSGIVSESAAFLVAEEFCQFDFQKFVHSSLEMGAENFIKRFIF